VGSKRRVFSAPECVLAAQGRSRSSKVDDFGTNRKRVCDFLLVRHWTMVLSGLSEIRRLIGNKLPIFPTHFSFGAPLLMFSFEFRAEVNHEETRDELSSSEDPMILPSVVLA